MSSPVPALSAQTPVVPHWDRSLLSLCPTVVNLHIEVNYTQDSFIIETGRHWLLGQRDCNQSYVYYMECSPILAFAQAENSNLTKEVPAR